MPVTDQAALRDLLFKLEPWDLGAAATVARYVATSDFTTEPEDDPPSTLFLGLVLDRPTFRRTLWRDGRIGGPSIPARGSLVLGSGARLIAGEPGDDPASVTVTDDSDLSGELDSWLALAWAGHRFTCWLKERGAPFSTAELVARGRFADMDFTRDRLLLPLRDRQEDERRPINQGRTYAGTGGFEGGADLAGKFRPLGYGPCRQVPMIPVDTANLWFDLHDGAIGSVLAVRDNGVSLLNDPANPPAAGKYYADLANGRIRLGSVPAGLPTADFEGSKLGGTYVSSVASIWRRICTLHMGLADPADLDTASFDALHALNPAPVGIWIGLEGASVAEVGDALFDSIGGWRSFAEDDRVQVGRFDVPDISGPDDPDCAFVLTEDDIVAGSMRRINPGLPASEISATYRFHHAVQDADAVAGGVSAANRLSFTQQTRSTAALAGADPDAFPTAEPLTIATRFDDLADAEAERDRRWGLHCQPADIFELAAGAEYMALPLGCQGWVAHSGFNLREGRAVGLIGSDPDRLRGQVTLQVWGLR